MQEVSIRLSFLSYVSEGNKERNEEKEEQTVSFTFTFLAVMCALGHNTAVDTHVPLPFIAINVTLIYLQPQ